jgi:predicted transcriptional regulator
MNCKALKLNEDSLFIHKYPRTVIDEMKLMTSNIISNDSTDIILNITKIMANEVKANTQT